MKILAFRVHIAILFVIVAGCVKEDFSVNKLDTSFNISPALATPVGYFDFGFDDVITTSDNSALYINSEKIIGIKYFGEVSSENAGDLFQFEPAMKEIMLENPAGSVIDLSSDPYQANLSLQVPLLLSNTGGKAELDSIIPSNASIRFSNLRFGPAFGEFIITIPRLTTGNQVFQAILTSNSSDTLIDISNYHLALMNLPEEKNLIEVNVEAIFPRQNSMLDSNSPMVQFNFEIDLAEWETIYGYLGNETIESGETIFNTDFEDTFPEGDFYFVQPLLKFITINSFGIPLGMGFSPIQAETLESGLLDLEGPGVPSPLNYFYPSYPQNQLSYVEVADSLLIDEQNSNLVEITEASPEKIHYRVLFQTNPDAKEQQNIIHDSSHFKTYVELDLPFYGKASNLVISDTLQADLSKLDIPLEENINNIIFKFYYENYFPANINLQLYFANEYMEITDTIFESFAEIKAAEPTNEYSENPPFVSGVISTSLPGYRIDDIRNTRFLIGEAHLNTTEGVNVKIFDNQSLFINLGVIFDINTTIEDF